MYHLSFENGYLTFLFLGPSMDDSVFVSLLISVPRGTQHLFFSHCNCPPIQGGEIFSGLHSTQRGTFSDGDTGFIVLGKDKN